MYNNVIIGSKQEMLYRTTVVEILSQENIHSGVKKSS